MGTVIQKGYLFNYRLKRFNTNAPKVEVRRSGQRGDTNPRNKPKQAFSLTLIENHIQHGTRSPFS